VLILGRKRNQDIVIGDDIVIKIVDIRGDVVKLGITAPVEVPVHRLEVAERIKREGKA
jgi:carbon storage regulator